MRFQFPIIFVTLIATLGMSSISIGLIAGNNRNQKIRMAVVEQSNQDKFISEREAHYLINREMDEILNKLPDSFSSRLNLIQASITNYEASQIPLLRFDVVNSRLSPGVAGGDLTQNLPLSQWAPILEELQAGNCQFIVVGNLPNGSVMRERFSNYGTTASLACPLISKENLIGVLFTSWNINDIGTINVDRAMEVCKTAVIKITAYLEISVNEKYRL